MKAVVRTKQNYTWKCYEACYIVFKNNGTSFNFPDASKLSASCRESEVNNRKKSYKQQPIMS